MTDSSAPSESLVPDASRDPLREFAAGTLSREDAVEALGLRDHADLLVALGDAGMTPPRSPAHVIEAEAALFETLWRAE